MDDYDQEEAMDWFAACFWTSIIVSLILGSVYLHHIASLGVQP
jgi:hypothetical protein